MKQNHVKPTNVEEFVSLGVRAGLIAKEDASRLLDALAKPSAGDRIGLRDLADRFVTAGILTSWQRRNLLRGRWKGFFLGDYKLQEPLGSGGMSVVYMATHLPSDCDVAIKVMAKDKLLHESSLKRFQIEARAAAMLDHPNIVHTRDLEVVDGQQVIVMELIRGTNLQEYVSAHGPLSISQTVDFSIQTASGLAHAHGANMVHRDIKPLNLLIGISGELKISDFGLARLLFEDSQTLTLQRSGKILGTADYLAPEQALDAHQVDGRADIYSLGCTMFYMLSGSPPFDSGNLANRVLMHQTAAPPDLRQFRSDIPEDLWAIVLKAMEKKPLDRFSSSAALLEVLSELRSRQVLSSAPPVYTNCGELMYRSPRTGMTSMDMLGFNL